MMYIPVVDPHRDTVMNLMFGDTLNGSKAEVNIPAMRMQDCLKSSVEKNQNDVMLCAGYEDVKRAVTDRKITVLLSIENGSAVENSLIKLKKHQ